jgi:LPXTG-site transpeptidase (sortase) family protein
MGMVKGMGWRAKVGNLLLIFGALVLVSVGLAQIKILLAAQSLDDLSFLLSRVDISLPLPEPPSQTNWQPQTELSTLPGEPVSLTSEPQAQAFLPLISNLPSPEIAVEEPPIKETNTESPTGPHQGPSSGQIIRLVVPSLKIDRAVVPVGLSRASGKQLTWNTDVLFSTNNRPDLVGQTVTSANPGEGGNIILIGHNYNNGWVYPNGVFVNLQKLTSGSKVIVYTEDGEKFTYIVQLVKKVPWRQQNNAELQKHQKYLLPTANEQLTLVTCGGANFGVWSARIYAVAAPSTNQASN